MLLGAEVMEPLSNASLYQKLGIFNSGEFEEAKTILNEMAQENNRPGLPYGLEGEQDKDALAEYKKVTYQDLLSNSVMRRVTIPLAALWIYREYIYYSSYVMLPELGNEITKNLILMSVSEVVAVLISYPIKLKIKRVNAFFFFTVLIVISSVLCSFTRLGNECMEIGNSCFTKFAYRISIMVHPC